MGSVGEEATGGGSYVSAISADGRFVTIISSATNLVAGDTNGLQDAFLKDRETGLVTRLSVDSAGNQATGGASTIAAFSADGRYAVIHSSASNLVSWGYECH